MKFILSSSALLKQLSSLSGVITSNPVVPILENFLFEINDGVLKVTASDLQTSMITEIGVEAKENGSIAIPAKILIDTLKNLPEQPVTFSIEEETYSVELSSENGRYKLSGENATDFPRVPTVDDGAVLDIPSDLLAKAIGNTIFATSADELRPAMSGVYISINDTNTTFVATDGHRLVRYRRVDIASDTHNTVLLPRKALTLLKNALPTSDNTVVKFEFTPSNAYFSFQNVQMICRLIDERFPDYENVIPQDNTKKLTIDRHEMISSLKRIAIYANKTTHQIRMKITGSDLVISAEDLDFSNEANERLTCEFEGEDIEIGFNGKFMLEMLNNITTPKIVMELSEPNRAGLILPETNDENEDVLMLVMPVMLNSYA
ncbi:MAG: DNA polymerase III subunit beta [Cyclobacteriaceae bacterium]